MAFGVTNLDIAPVQIIVVIALFARIFPRFASLQTQIHNLNTFIPSIEHVTSIYAAASARRERTTVDGSNLALTLPTTLDVRGLRVAFDENVVLDGLYLSLPVPGMIGIVGGSGAGKSTLVHALLGLVLPSGGTIRLGAHDLGSASNQGVASCYRLCAPGNDPVSRQRMGQPDLGAAGRLTCGGRRSGEARQCPRLHRRAAAGLRYIDR